MENILVVIKEKLIKFKFYGSVFRDQFEFCLV